MALRATNNREENTPAAIFRAESFCTSFESGNMFLYIDPTIVPDEDSYAESDSLSFDRLLVTRQNHSQAPICTRPLDTPFPRVLRLRLDRLEAHLLSNLALMPGL